MNFDITVRHKYFIRFEAVSVDDTWNCSEILELEYSELDLDIIAKKLEEMHKKDYDKISFIEDIKFLI